jgi:hypothetical protein
VSVGDYVFIDIINGLIGATASANAASGGQALRSIVASERNVSFDIYVI